MEYSKVETEICDADELKVLKMKVEEKEKETLVFKQKVTDLEIKLKSSQTDQKSLKLKTEVMENEMKFHVHDNKSYTDEIDSLKNINESYIIDNKELKITSAMQQDTIGDLIQKIDILIRKDVEINNHNATINAQKEEIDKMKSDFVCDKCSYKGESLKSFLTHLTKKHSSEEIMNVTCKYCEFKCQNENK